MIRILAAVALVAVAMPAAATAEPQEVVVTLSNADLALSDGRFRKKIASAIEQVCGSYAAVEPYQWPGIDECRQAAWTGVRQQLADLKPSETVKLSAR